jgi:hypothetical protein
MFEIAIPGELKGLLDSIGSLIVRRVPYNIRSRRGRKEQSPEGQREWMHYEEACL